MWKKVKNVQVKNWGAAGGVLRRRDGRGASHVEAEGCSVASQKQGREIVGSGMLDVRCGGFATGGFALLLAAESQHYIELRKNKGKETGEELRRRRPTGCSVASQKQGREIVESGMLDVRCGWFATGGVLCFWLQRANTTLSCAKIKAKRRERSFAGVGCYAFGSQKQILQYANSVFCGCLIITVMI